RSSGGPIATSCRFETSLAQSAQHRVVARTARCLRRHPVHLSKRELCQVEVATDVDRPIPPREDLNARIHPKEIGVRCERCVNLSDHVVTESPALEAFIHPCRAPPMVFLVLRSNGEHEFSL